jgi:hypothetical protein
MLRNHYRFRAQLIGVSTFHGLDFEWILVKDNVAE